MIFDSLKSLDWTKVFSYYLELGYVLMNKLVHMFGGNFRVILLINAFITVVGIYKFIIENSNDKIMSIYLFISIGYFCSAMNVMRQYLAVAFVLLAYTSVIKGKSFFKVAIYIFIASLFHSSALICLGVILIYYIVYSKRIKQSIILKGLTLLGTIIVLMLLEKILSIFAAQEYNYLTVGAAYQYNIVSFSFLFKVVLVIAGFVVLKRKNINDDNIVNIRFFNYINIVSCILNIASIWFSMFTRLNIYFSFSMIVLVPMLIENIQIKNKTLLKLGIYILFFVLFYTQLVDNGTGIVPYNTIM
jgi:hypothetical protein